MRHALGVRGKWRGNDAEEGNTVDFHEEGRCDGIVDDQRWVRVDVGIGGVVLTVRKKERTHQQRGEHGMNDVFPFFKLSTAVLDEFELLLRRKVLLLQAQISYLDSVELQVVARPSHYTAMSNQQKGDRSRIGLGSVF